MLATSWKATGLVRAAWLRLDVEKDHRGELARLTGIPTSNLSGMNTGRIPMTQEMAERICAAVPGLSVLELGAPAEMAGKRGLLLQDRVDRLERALRVAVARGELSDPEDPSGGRPPGEPDEEPAI